MKKNLEPREIVPAVFQYLKFEGFQRIDGHCVFKNEEYKFVAYKVNQPIPLIRIDIREKEK